LQTSALPLGYGADCLGNFARRKHFLKLWHSGLDAAPGNAYSRRPIN
jgi:hypothetical protein